MPDADARGPKVDPAEDLYRAIHLPDWWNKKVAPLGPDQPPSIGPSSPSTSPR